MGRYNRNYYLRQTQRGWVRKQYLIEQRGGGCQACGYNKCSRCLSFHHRDPSTKSFMLDVRNIGNKKWDVVLDEFAKCDLLCMNCHGEVHHEETDKSYFDYEMTRRESKLHVCVNCGKDFKVTASHAERDNGGHFCSMECFGVSRRKVERPSNEQLAELVWKMPTTKIAETYGVSDKAVGKWCKNYGIEKPPRGYWAKQNN
jgi:hypothetical protein